MVETLPHTANNYASHNIAGSVPSFEFSLKSAHFIPNGTSEIYSPNEIGIGGAGLRVVSEVSVGSETYEDGRIALVEVTDPKGNIQYGIQGLSRDREGRYAADDNPAYLIGGPGSTFIIGGSAESEYRMPGITRVRSGALWSKGGGYSLKRPAGGLCFEVLDRGVVVLDELAGRTTLKVAESTRNNETDTDTVPANILDQIEKPPGESAKMFEVDGVKYNVRGVTNGKGYSVYVMDGVGRNGARHTFGVYQSKSEGGWRATNGYEDGRYLKGREDIHAQYTQDTQLHPDFLDALARQLPTQEAVAALPSIDHSAIELDESATALAEEAFCAETQVYGFHHDKLNALLAKVPAGYLGRSILRTRLGGPEQGLSVSLDRYVAELNQSLYESGVVPDFSQAPKEAQRSYHPVLGTTDTEVFVKSGIEWHISTDASGRCWVDRIRFSDARPTAFGTDDKLVYSGILTSKPLEYRIQADGIDPRYVKATDSKYVDITPFLASLYPIQAYKAAKIQRKH